MIERDWLLVASEPDPLREARAEISDLHAQLAARDGLIASLCRWGRHNEARAAFLDGRLRRLRGWIMRLPKPAGAPRQPVVGKRRARELRAEARGIAAAKKAAAERERGEPVTLRRRVVVVTKGKPAEPLERAEAKITTAIIGKK
jgi:hypothetical protein